MSVRCRAFENLLELTQVSLTFVFIKLGILKTEAATWYRNERTHSETQQGWNFAFVIFSIVIVSEFRLSEIKRIN